jgi:hypothetical protein
MLTQDQQGLVKRLYRQVKTFAVWLVASILILPVVMMLHELGHFLPAVVLGFHHVRIHYESTRYANDSLFWGLIQGGAKSQAAALFPFWKVAAVEIAGPLMSIVMLFVAATYARRFWIAAVIGIVGLFHFVAPALFVWINFRNARHGLPAMQHWGMDEFDFWILTGVPVRTILLAELALIVPGLVLVGRAIQKGTRAAAWAAMVCGMRIGIPLYFAIGPHLLP